MTITGTYVESGLGVLAELLRGTGAGQAGLLAASGPLSLTGGTLLANVSGFSLAAGQTFTVATFEPGTGPGFFGNLQDGGSIGSGTSVDIGGSLTLGALYCMRRPEIIAALGERGIDFVELREAAGQREADPFDLLCHVAFNAPLRTRRERAQRLRSERKDFFERYGEGSRQVLEELIEKYAEHGDARFALPDVRMVPPISEHGRGPDIIRLFGGADNLRSVVTELQEHLYAA